MSGACNSCQPPLLDAGTGSLFITFGRAECLDRARRRGAEVMFAVSAGLFVPADV